MPSSFDVTTATNTIRLDNKRHGELTVTVFNTATQPKRGRIQLGTQQQELVPWVSLAGNQERDFQPSGAQQYTFTVEVPPEAQAGTYRFHVDMVGVDNPDEDYTEGPVVSFDVPKVDAPQTRPFLWWIVAVAIIALVVMGGTIFLLTRGETNPPDSAASKFLGTWINENPKNTAITRLVISQSGDTFTVQAFRSCLPNSKQECLIESSPAKLSNQTLIIDFNDKALNKVTITPKDADELRVEISPSISIPGDTTLLFKKQS
jgi:hypothetical protein